MGFEIQNIYTHTYSSQVNDRSKKLNNIRHLTDRLYVYTYGQKNTDLYFRFYANFQNFQLDP